MSLACKPLLLLALAWVVLPGPGNASRSEFRVCADPNNLPFSNQRAEGFENAVARLVARDLGRPLRFVWASQRRAYLRKNLFAGHCDAVMGIPTAMDEVATTLPWYRSSYVFVSLRGQGLHVSSFDDPRLRTARIGVQLVQNDGAVTPPAQALLRRGLRENIRWYKLYPDFTRPNPPAALIEGVERGDIDIAVAWGPLAGYFAGQSAVPLSIVSVSQPAESPVPLAFDISMGVRPGNRELLSELNSFIRRRRPEISALLRRYGVPLPAGIAQPVALTR